MGVLSVGELKAGMVIDQPVITPSGQLIVKAGTSLTTQMINHLSFYNVKKASVSESPATISDLTPSIENKEAISYEQRVRDSIEYKHFEQTFIENVENLRNYINDIIIKSDETHGSILLNQTLALFDSLNDKVNIFDMLHCIRKIDDSTYAHSVNVAIICRLMGQWLGFSEDDVDVLTLCGLLHDVGKCKTPRNILQKPGKLSTEEYAIIKRHSVNGYEILKNQELDPRIKRAALMHHERCDGSGYPLGLVREDIDSFAVIVSIADVYDAMTTSRCYRDAICPFEVIATFEKEGFEKYNKNYISVFLNHIVDTYMNNQVLLNNGNKGQIIWKNKEYLARPTLFLPSREFLDLAKHPELYIQAII